MDNELLKLFRVELARYIALQSVLLIISILFIRRKENYWLMAYFSVLAFIGIVTSLDYAGFDLYKVPYFFFFVDAVDSLYPAIFCYHAASLLGKETKWTKLLWIVPVVLYAIYSFEYIINHQLGYVPFNLWVKRIYYTGAIVFTVWLLKQMYRGVYDDTENELSQKNKVQLYWFIIFQYLFILQCAVIVSVTFQFSSSKSYTALGEWLIFSIDVINALFVLILTYIAFRAPYILNVSKEERPLTIEEIVLESVLPAELKSKARPALQLTEKEQAIYTKKLTQVLEDEKAYLQSDLSVAKLAEQLKLPPKVLSQLIHLHFDKNFFELINHFRIEHACNLLKDPVHDKDTLYGIAVDSGFNSESAFYRVFKNTKGVTPTQFKKQHEAS